MIIKLQRHDFKVKNKPRREIPVATCTGVWGREKRRRNLGKKKIKHRCDESFRRASQDGLPQNKFSWPSRTSGVQKTKVKEENEREESGTEENPFQALRV